jgi:membrane associated rhomboid family serine protease
MQAAPPAVPNVPDWLPLEPLFLLAAILVSLAVARWLSTDSRWGDVLRHRFVLGLPWGTVATVMAVLSVYWFVQGGWDQAGNPLVVPFRTWSYFYPLGMLAGPFTHGGVGHVTGNMIGTLTFAPIVEYVWGHYPRERGSEAFASARSNPFVRILAVPVASFVVGIITGLFALGPVVGFSGVVFAYAGFVFVSRPIAAVLALAASDVVRLVWRSLRNPRLVAEPRPAFITPWWSDVAVQGHALGVFLGVILALVLLYRRNDRPNPVYLWFAAVIFGIDQTLWALYLPLSGNRFVMFRAIGVGAVFLLGALIVAAGSMSRPLSVARSRFEGRHAVAALLLCLLVVTAVVAVPYNLFTVSETGPIADNASVDVRDYTVAYAEDVPNQYVSALDVSALGSTTQINSSGVIVVSEQRNIWIQQVSKSKLAFQGDVSIVVGGLDWRETVRANRVTWSAVGNGSTYRVTLQRDGGERKVAFLAPPVEAEPTIDGRNVSLTAGDNAFSVAVTRNETVLDRAEIPAAGNETAVGGFVINRTERNLYAISNDTRVRIGKKVKPRSERDR